ncbi:DUF3560 domain-containing protein [Pirellulales bacterium]|nr:DUF3560 domain-containing protein [Pirellulales bacterium]
MGFPELDAADPLSNPVHAALAELRASGDVVAHEPDWGEPSFELTNDEPNAYEEKLQARIERYEERAAKNQSAASSRYSVAREMGDAIPFGQPIASNYNRDRDIRYRERMRGHFAKGVEHQDKAAYYEEKATAAENNRAVSSDDPTAVSQLRTKLESRETLQAYMKAVNRGIRKAKLESLPKEEVPARLKEIVQSVTDDEASQRELLKRLIDNAKFSTYGFIFPPYELTNNNAQIRRLKERVAQLEQASSRETTEVDHQFCTVVENVEENRIQIIFPAKPDKETRQLLGGENFRWSRTNGAWQRHLNAAGRSAVKRVLAEITPEGPSQHQDATLDAADIKGNELAKRQLVISACGNHSVSFIGAEGIVEQLTAVAQHLEVTIASPDQADLLVPAETPTARETQSALRGTSTADIKTALLSRGTNPPEPLAADAQAFLDRAISELAISETALITLTKLAGTIAKLEAASLAA